MLVILLAVVVAIGWGASDYFGGDTSGRDLPVFTTVAARRTDRPGGLMIPVLAVHGTLPPADPGLALAAAAGVAVTIELSLIYRALGNGQAFITAPVGALGAAIAVSAGMIGGDPLSLTIAAGLVLALAGGAISSWTSPAGPAPRTGEDRRDLHDRRRQRRHGPDLPARRRPGRPVLGGLHRACQHGAVGRADRPGPRTQATPSAWPARPAPSVRTCHHRRERSRWRPCLHDRLPARLAQHPGRDLIALPGHHDHPGPAAQGHQADPHSSSSASPWPCSAPPC